MPQAFNHPHDSAVVNRLNLRLKAILTQAKISGNKTLAMKKAEDVLNEFFNYLIKYTWNTRITKQITSPVNVSKEDKDALRNKLVAEKLAKFKRILDDA